MKLEEVLQAYRDGKTIVYGIYAFNIISNQARLQNAEDFQIIGDMWTIKKEKVKKYPVLLQRIGDSWNDFYLERYTVTEDLFCDFEDAKMYFYDRRDILKVIRLITEIPELIEEVEE